MKIIIKEGVLYITTNAYQAKNGGIYLSFGNKTQLLDVENASSILYDIPDYDLDDFRKFYQIK